MSVELAEIIGTDSPKEIEKHKKAILKSYDAGGSIRSDDYAGRIPYINLVNKGIFGQPEKSGELLNYPLTEEGQKLASKLDMERFHRMPGHAIF